MASEKSNLTPLVPVITVRLIIKNKDEQVLILRRPVNSHGAGGWCLPGGKVDFGDTVEATVSKELEEETALQCTEKHFLFYQDSLPSDASDMHVINLYFLCEAEGQVRLNDESSEYKWISQDDMASYQFVFRNGEGLRRYWD